MDCQSRESDARSKRNFQSKRGYRPGAESSSPKETDENWEMSVLLLSAQGEPTTGGCKRSSIPAVGLLGIPQDDVAGQGASGAGAGFLLEAFSNDLGDVPQGDGTIALGLFQEVGEVFSNLRFGFVHSLLMEFSI